jgi:sulfur carrier protein
MPNIMLNGELRELRAGITVIGLLETAGFSGRKVAVEINQEIVPKSAQAERVLAEGDRVEIVHAMGGG